MKLFGKKRNKIMLLRRELHIRNNAKCRKQKTRARYQNTGFWLCKMYGIRKSNQNSNI